MKLLEKDGWIPAQRRTHGVFFHKFFPGEPVPRSTVIPDKSEPLNDFVFGAIVSVKQTGIGKAGYQQLVDKYGLE